MYKANIVVTLRPSILDPQGKATQHALQSVGFTGVDRIRMGKYVEMWIDAESEEAAREVAAASCRKVLANQVMEDFHIEMEEVQAEQA